MVVIGIGLPRTGTKSLAEALYVLGFSGYHYCSLNKNMASFNQVEVKEANIFDITTYYYNNYQDIYNDAYYYILTHRNKESWLKSCAKFDPDPSIPDIDVYKEDVVKFFNKNNGKLLVLDLENQFKWNQLCSFLNKEIPKCDYPEVK